MVGAIALGLQVGSEVAKEEFGQILRTAPVLDNLKPEPRVH